MGDTGEQKHYYIFLKEREKKMAVNFSEEEITQMYQMYEEVLGEIQRCRTESLKRLAGQRNQFFKNHG